jgi:transposase-like protein
MGISDQTIRNWLKDCKSGKLKLDTLESSPRYFSIHEKYLIIRESCGMSESELGYFLRERGLHSEHLKLWDQELREYMDNKKSNKDKELRDLKKRNKQLEKELSRKEKALAETAALLVLKKNMDDLITGNEED